MTNLMDTQTYNKISEVVESLKQMFVTQRQVNVNSKIQELRAIGITFNRVYTDARCQEWHVLKDGKVIQNVEFTR